VIVCPPASPSGITGILRWVFRALVDLGLLRSGRGRFGRGSGREVGVRGRQREGPQRGILDLDGGSALGRSALRALARSPSLASSKRYRDWHDGQTMIMPALLLNPSTRGAVWLLDGPLGCSRIIRIGLKWPGEFSGPRRRQLPRLAGDPSDKALRRRLWNASDTLWLGSDGDVDEDEDVKDDELEDDDDEDEGDGEDDAEWDDPMTSTRTRTTTSTTWTTMTMTSRKKTTRTKSDTGFRRAGR